MNYLVFDLETIVRPIPESIKSDLESKIKAKYKTEEVVAKHLEGIEEDWKWMPGAQKPICACFYDFNLDTYSGLQSDNEVEIAEFFLDQFGELPYTKLVGFNIKKFDIPNLIVSLSKTTRSLDHRLGRYDFIDLMKEPHGYDVGMYSLSYYASIFGLQSKSGTGGDVEEMYRLDRGNGTTQVKDYCLGDVRITKELFEIYSKLHKF